MATAIPAANARAADEGTALGFFPGRSAHAAWLKLGYLLERGHGLAVLTGEPGCGKSLLSSRLTAVAAAAGDVTAHVAFPLLDVDELLAFVDAALTGGDVPGNRSVHVRRIEGRLARLAAEGRRALLTIDDAHLVGSDAVFDALGLLLNLRQFAGANLSIVLAGNLSLLASLRRRPELAQKIDLAAHVSAFEPAETAAFAKLRLSENGFDPEEFGEEAATAVHDAAHGVPRLVRRLCEMACVLAEADGSRRVGPETIEAAAAEFLPTAGA